MGGCEEGKQASKQYGTIERLCFSDNQKFRPTDAWGKWEPGEQKGGTLAEGGENLPSFKSLSDRVTLIGGPGEGGVTAPACLRTSSRLGYDKSSALNHSLYELLRVRMMHGEWIGDKERTRRRTLSACARTSDPLRPCKTGASVSSTILPIKTFLSSGGKPGMFPKLTRG